MPVARIEPSQFGLEGVEVVVGEDWIGQRFDAAEDIERPGRAAVKASFNRLAELET